MADEDIRVGLIGAGELANGAQVHMRMSATTGLSTGNQSWFYGTTGVHYMEWTEAVMRSAQTGQAIYLPL